MAKFCSKCGNEVSEENEFCSKCGAKLNGESSSDSSSNSANNNYPRIPNRNIVTSIILSFITCGFYSVYWFIIMTDEANAISDDNSTSGGMAFLFTLLTCSIYSIYWSYQMGKKLHEAGLKYGKNIQDNSVLYLILSIFGLGIINYCLIQSDLNRFSD